MDLITKQKLNTIQATTKKFNSSPAKTSTGFKFNSFNVLLLNF